jgi:hypothetical protein
MARENIDHLASPVNRETQMDLELKPDAEELARQIETADQPRGWKVDEWIAEDEAKRLREEAERTAATPPPPEMTAKPDISAWEIGAELEAEPETVSEPAAELATMILPEIRKNSRLILTPTPAEVISITLGELLKKVIPEREDILERVAKVDDCALITGQSGRGKSLDAMAKAIAISGGMPFAGLSVPKARPTAYWDAEMLEIELKERARQLAPGLGLKPKEIGDLPLLFVSEMAQDGETPTFDTPAGLARVERFLDRHPDIEVLFIDSLRILFDLEDENTSPPWKPVNRFNLRMKKRGITVIGVHHNNNSDTFNGHNSGKTTWAQIINLTARTEGADEAGVMAFDWSYVKSRSLRGKEKKPFGLQLIEEPDGRLYFAQIDASAAKNPQGITANDPRRAAYYALRNQGMTVRAACDSLKIKSLSTVDKWKKEDDARRKKEAAE